VAFDPATTWDTARQAYHDNADYDVDGSVSKAKLFVAACRELLDLVPDMQQLGSAEQQQRTQKYENEMDRAQRFIAVNDTDNGAGVTHVDFADFRS